MRPEYHPATGSASVTVSDRLLGRSGPLELIPTTMCSKPSSAKGRQLAPTSGLHSYPNLRSQQPSIGSSTLCQIPTWICLCLIYGCMGLADSRLPRALRRAYSVLLALRAWLQASSRGAHVGRGAAGGQRTPCRQS